MQVLGERVHDAPFGQIVDKKITGVLQQTIGTLKYAP
jgi:hypothetical protein